jgi:hypothetical protein
MKRKKIREICSERDFRARLLLLNEAISEFKKNCIAEPNETLIIVVVEFESLIE